MVFNRVNYTVKPSILPGPARKIQHARTARRILHFSRVMHARRADEGVSSTFSVGEAARREDEGSSSTFSVGEAARRADEGSLSTFSVGEGARRADEGLFPFLRTMFVPTESTIPQAVQR